MSLNGCGRLMRDGLEMGPHRSRFANCCLHVTLCAVAGEPSQAKGAQAPLAFFLF